MRQTICTLFLLLLPASLLAAPGSTGTNESSAPAQTGLVQQVDNAELAQIQGRYYPVRLRDNGPVTTTAEIILWDEGYRTDHSMTHIQGTGNAAVTILESHSY